MDKLVVLQMNGAVGALGQRFAKNGLGSRGSRSQHDDFAAVFLFLTEGLLECVGVGLVDFVGDVFADPGSGFVEFEGRVFLRDLLDTDEDFHDVRCSRFSITEADTAGTFAVRVA